MPIENMEASKSQVSYRVEVPEVATVGAGVSNRTVPVVASGTIVPHRYAQQKCRVIRGGSAVGDYYSVIDNTSTTLILEENAEDGNVTADDKIAIQTYGQPPNHTAAGGVDKHFGEIQSSDLPLPSWELWEGWYHGHSNMPQRSEATPMVKTYESSGIEQILKNMQFMAMAFGTVEESPTVASGTNGTLNTVAYPGENELQLDSIGMFSAGDIIHIENGSSSGLSETAIVGTAVAPASLYLQSPLKNFHGSNATVNLVRVDGDGNPTGPIKHTLTVGDEVPCFTFEQSYLRDRIANDVGNHLVNQFMGLIITSAEFSSMPGDTNPLSSSYDISGLQYRNKLGNNTPGELGDYISVPSTVVKEGFDRGPYKFHWSKVTVNGVEYGEAGEFTSSITRDTERHYGHYDGDKPFYSDGDPIRHIFGKVESSSSLKIPLKNKNFLELLKEGTSFDTEYLFYRNSTSEYLKITHTNCYLTEPIFDLPEPGLIEQDIQASSDTIEIEVTDYLPYYAL